MERTGRGMTARPGPDGAAGGGTSRADLMRQWSRTEVLLVVVLLALAATAWVLTSRLATADMRIGVLTGGPAMSEMDVAMRPWPWEAALFLGVWVVMMAAMMLPSIVPFSLGMRRLLRSRGVRGDGLFVGYFVVWAAAGTAAFAFVRGLETVVTGPSLTAVRVGGMVLLVAGVYQLTPLKRVCLRHCRSPMALLLEHSKTALHGRFGVLRVGLSHGAYCLGCCWALMAVLVAAGMMNLVWMAVFAVVVALEKVTRHGELVSRVVGGLLIVTAIVLLAHPALLT
ncbi:DUF2182 domain-containing protein [Prauserella sp. YIM 121212]